MRPRNLFRVSPIRRASVFWKGIAGLIGCVFFGGATASAQMHLEYEQAPINYSATPATNRVSLLQEKIEAEKIFLNRRDEKELLQNLLELLDVPVESQVLVFSKTSLQRRLIAPHRPRAIYFSDDAYIGWAPGGLIEAAVSDPKLGLVFYHFDPGAGESPRFVRDAQCLSCHGGSMTRNWPGVMVRSVFPDSTGELITSAGTFLIGHDSPFEERWGGWYVTGRHGEGRHMGNVTARRSGFDAELDREAGANLTGLSRFFPVERYPRPDSDIVALMVLEHQVEMHNRLTQGALRSRKWIHYQRALQSELGQTVTEELTGTARRVVESEAERIVEYLLFVDEIRLPSGGIEGSGGFQSAFRENRRADGQDRSLKDFDLKTRLFTYRCSYMIYSEAFESLPAELKGEVYKRLLGVLKAPRPPRAFRHLDWAERQAIYEILTATKEDLPADWTEADRE